jgi:hypothetical protein
MRAAAGGNVEGNLARERKMYEKTAEQKSDLEKSFLSSATAIGRALHENNKKLSQEIDMLQSLERVAGKLGR